MAEGGEAINPVSGEGSAYAMTAAHPLIETLPDKLVQNAKLGTGLAESERALRARPHPYLSSSNA
jgi:flavin-dependent dehydrogenase